MANNSVKTSVLPVASTVARTDRVVILVNPASTANTKTANLDVFMANVSISNSVPANSSANGYIGTIRADESYIYICTANNTWKRAAISTW